ncbi:hypothetical protein EDD85DRAFT_798393 [Armillaria nabsnona]|nr:hypothetical protein EDD85DRAFT_798393 [Armillaria nabsnona]
MSSKTTPASKMSKLQELFRELDAENIRKSLDIGMHCHLKTLARKLITAESELKNTSQRLEEAEARLLNIMSNSQLQSVDREKLAVRLCSAEANLETAKQWSMDTEARLLNEKQILTDKVAQYTQDKDELVNENSRWQYEYSLLQQELQTSVTEIQRQKGIVETLHQNIQSSMECSICCNINVVPVCLQCGHGFCGNCVLHWLAVKPRSATCPTCRARISPKPSIVRPFAEITHAILATVDKDKLLELVGTNDFGGELDSTMNGCQTKRLEGECFDDAMRIISVSALKFPKSFVPLLERRKGLLETTTNISRAWTFLIAPCLEVRRGNPSFKRPHHAKDRIVFGRKGVRGKSGPVKVRLASLD